MYFTLQCLFKVCEGLCSEGNYSQKISKVMEKKIENIGQNRGVMYFTSKKP